MTITTKSVSTDSRFHVLTCASAEALGVTGEHELDEAEVAAEAVSSHETREQAYAAARELGGDCYVIDTEGTAHYVAAVVPVVYRLVPAGTRDVYAAGYDGNSFTSEQEALDAIPGLRACGPEFDHDWDVIAE
jgi:hypothetical protein